MRVGLALVALGFVTASCSSGRLQPDGAGQLPSDAAGGDAAVPPGAFITADVDGVTIRAEMNAAAYSWSGIKDGWLDGYARNADWIWYVGARNVVDTAGASSASVMLAPVGSTIAFLSDQTGGSAATAVTAAAPNPGDLFEGTFTATLIWIGDTPMTKVVSNGSFHLPRVNGMPPPQ